MVALYGLIRATDLCLIGINLVSFARQVKFATVLVCRRLASAVAAVFRGLLHRLRPLFLVRQHFFAFVVIHCSEFG